MSTDSTHLDLFPGMDEIHEECREIQSVRIGDGHASLSRPSVASEEVDKLFNLAITYHRNSAALFQAMSAFFSRDNVALPGVALYFKVQYKKINDHYNLAQKHGDAHAQFFLGNAITAVSEKIRAVSHHLTHLKMVESDKHAIEEFHRRLPFELEDYAMAAAVESTVPARLQMGTGLRATVHQSKQFDFNKNPASSIRSRAAFNQVL